MTTLYSKVVKTAVSIPDAIFRAADRLARERRISRSELYATALQTYLQAADRQDVTDRLNEIYADSEPPDPFTEEAARRTLGSTDW